MDVYVFTILSGIETYTYKGSLSMDKLIKNIILIICILTPAVHMHCKSKAIIIERTSSGKYVEGYAIEKTKSGEYVQILRDTDIVYREKSLIFQRNGFAIDESGLLHKYFKNQNDGECLQRALYWKLEDDQLFIGIYYKYGTGYPKLHVKSTCDYKIIWRS